HEIAGLIGTNRNDREPERALPRNLVHPAPISKSGGPAEEAVAAWQQHGDRRPERAIAVSAPARTPMMVAFDQHVDTGFHRNTGAPVACDRPNAVSCKDRVIAQAADAQP